MQKFFFRIDAAKVRKKTETACIFQKKVLLLPRKLRIMISLAIQQLQTLSPAQQKLAVLYAYVGGPLSDDDRTQLSVHGTCMLGELPILTAQLVEQGFVATLPATHFAPQCEQIRPRYYGDVLLFALTY
ncbi:MAG: hypothetical protein IKS49_02350, partial [Actinomycetaceae bacterium]|nr:hypothetical protein [Actinomycetaceae bacterium]